MESPVAPEVRAPSSPSYFFEEILRGPMEELRVTAEKWLQLHSRLGETATAHAVARAYTLARDKLAETICAGSRAELTQALAPPAPPEPSPSPPTAADPPAATDPTSSPGP